MSKRPRRAAVASQELVPVRNRLWEESVKEVLRGVVQWNRTRDGYRSPESVREMIRMDSAARLEALIVQENNRLGTA